MYICEVVLKTAQETGGIRRNHWEIGGTRWNLGGNSGEISGKIGRKLENCVSPMGKQNSLTGGKRGKMSENCFTKIPIWGICVKQVGEMKANFVLMTSFNCTVLYIVMYIALL